MHCKTPCRGRLALTDVHAGDHCVLRGPDLVVDDGHVKISKLLEGVGEVGMRLSHLSIQEDAAVIEGDALLVVPQLVVDGPNEQQQVCPVCMRWVDLRTGIEALKSTYTSYVALYRYQNRPEGSVMPSSHRTREPGWCAVILDSGPPSCQALLQAPVRDRQHILERNEASSV